MALPSSGAISMSQVRKELGASGAISLGSSSVRNLAGRPSGSISMSQLRGKGGYAGTIITVQMETYGTDGSTWGRIYLMDDFPVPAPYDFYKIFAIYSGHKDGLPHISVENASNNSVLPRKPKTAYIKVDDTPEQISSDVQENPGDFSETTVVFAKPLGNPQAYDTYVIKNIKLGFTF